MTPPRSYRLIRRMLPEFSSNVFLERFLPPPARWLLFAGTVAVPAGTLRVSGDANEVPEE
jgi:hypothetical protein